MKSPKLVVSASTYEQAEQVWDSLEATGLPIVTIKDLELRDAKGWLLSHREKTIAFDVAWDTYGHGEQSGPGLWVRTHSCSIWPRKSPNVYEYTGDLGRPLSDYVTGLFMLMLV